MATENAYEVNVRYGAVPSRTVVLSSVESSEYERFEELAAKLVKTPKPKRDEPKKS